MWSSVNLWCKGTNKFFYKTKSCIARGSKKKAELFIKKYTVPALKQRILLAEMGILRCVYYEDKIDLKEKPLKS